MCHRSTILMCLFWLTLITSCTMQPEDLILINGEIYTMEKRIGHERYKGAYGLNHFWKMERSFHLVRIGQGLQRQNIIVIPNI